MPRNQLGGAKPSGSAVGGVGTRGRLLPTLLLSFLAPRFKNTPIGSDRIYENRPPGTEMETLRNEAVVDSLAN